MSSRQSRILVVVFGLVTTLVAGLPGTSHAARVHQARPRAGRGGPGKWTKLATTDTASATIGMLRTSDGHLHLAWLNKSASPTSHTFGTATLSLAGGVLGTGTAFSHWNTLEDDPQLVKDGSSIRLVFEGATGNSGCFSTGLVYTATSTDGLTFALANNTSMSNASFAIGHLAATVESDGTTPVATFAAGHLFHVGTDSCPAPPGSDGTITNESGGANPSNPAIATDKKNGSVYVAWFQTNNSTVSYRVDRILPTKTTPVTAPGSGSTLSENNQPHQPVALSARAGGGVYMAYCVATSIKLCAHIALWKVGATSAMTVPGSSTGDAGHVALAAGKQGRITVLWFDRGQNLIHAVRTNQAATAFGVDRTIKPPPNTAEIQDVQGEGTFGRLDVLVNAALNTSGFPSTIWQTQILAGLTLTASPKSFSHTAAHTVTFTVKDAGNPVQGAKVSCLGKSGTTNSNGVVQLTFPKGTATGHHVATATHADYNPGKTTITVT